MRLKFRRKLTPVIIVYKSKYTKMSVYCQYGQYNVSNIGPSSERKFWLFLFFSLTKSLCSKRLYYPYWQYTDLFIFRFVSLLCLRSTLRRHSHQWVRSIWDRSKSKVIWMRTLKCELRSIQDRSKLVWTLSQSELRSISDRSNLDRS